MADKEGSVLAPWEDRKTTPRARGVCYNRGGTRRDQTVFPYSQLIWINFQPSSGIIVHYSSHTVFIRGSRLEPIFHQLRDQSLLQLDTNELEVDDDNESPFVKKIQIMQKAGESEPFLFPADDADEETADDQ